MDNLETNVDQRVISKIEIANQVRNALERFAEEHEYPKDLSGLCSIASIILAKLFVLNGYSAKVVYGDVKNSFGHCWVLSSRKHYDITATQFGHQKIFVISDKDLPIYDYKKRQKIDLSIGDYNKNFDHWTEKTRPTVENIAKVMKYLKGWELACA